MPLLSRSLRSLPPLLPPIACLCLSLSAFPATVPPLCRTVSLSLSLSPGLALSATSNVLRQARLRSHANVLPPPPLTILFLFRHHHPPPRLIHIHAVVIVCRLPAGGHYYTSCARSRHREATTPATLLLLTLLPSPSPFLLVRFPHPAAAADAASSFGSMPRISVTTHNPRIFYYRVSWNNSRTYHAVLPQGFFICWLCSREFANNCAQTFLQNAPWGDVSVEGLRSRFGMIITKLYERWCVDLCIVMCDDSQI